MASTQSLVFLLFFAVTLIACVNSSCKLMPKDCGTSKGTLHSVIFGGNCSGNEHIAQLVRGTDARLQISFTANEDSNTLTSVVYGYVFNLPYHFHLENPNACKDSNVTCPIKAGQRYTYTSAIPVKTVYPRLSLVIKWRLQDDHENDMVCFLIPAQIV